MPQEEDPGMDERVHAVRARQWAEVIAACNSSGQQKSDWPIEHGINSRQFYYWQRKLRGELYEVAENKECTELELHAENKPTPAFAELTTVPAPGRTVIFSWGRILRFVNSCALP